MSIFTHHDVQIQNVGFQQLVFPLFSSSVQVITSQEKEITIKRPNGETTTATVRIWNETVSNLTLMALGSSAPEILLSVIEVSARRDELPQVGSG